MKQIYVVFFCVLQRDSLAAYNEATANATKTPQIVIEPPTIGSQSDMAKATVNENLSNCEAKNHTSAADEEDTALTVGMLQQENRHLCVLRMLHICLIAVLTIQRDFFLNPLA